VECASQQFGRVAPHDSRLNLIAPYEIEGIIPIRALVQRMRQDDFEALI
jgi:hypothetical protein